ncbi:2-hydroxyacyl-CoA dehydratase family protein [Bianquea renquensis]|jgi:hypothetical protein|uniref:2-hydroxyacyl-CoA dehydratase n=1 Tax=Bianquea renquensis TaxID=2763661 RepID=A0A926I0S3_9FIRM|nr:2-hydroxyacyl-CoA dehydratase family protein [Bianquea renquensis]MBC8542748.1 2-hydroxyacyl-CoA dehydratase [Bianquea renquensis]
MIGKMNGEFSKRLNLAARLFEAKGKQYMAAYLRSSQRRIEKIEGGAPYAVCTYYFPSEIAAALNLEFLYIEKVVGLAMGVGIIRRGSIARQPEAVCSYQQAFCNLLDMGILPKPKVILGVPFPCRDAISLCRFLHSRHAIPFFEVKSATMARDFQHVVQSLSAQLGYRESLPHVLALSAQATALKKEVDTYRRRYPGIIESEDCMNLFTIENDFGLPSAVTVLQELLRNVRSRVPLYQEPAYKILWMGLVPLYDSSFLKKVEQTVGGSIVMEEMWLYDHRPIGYQHFYDDLAHRIRQSFFYSLGRRQNVIHKTAERMKVSAVVNFLQHQCSFLPRTAKSFSERFVQANIPYVVLGCDVIHGPVPEWIWGQLKRLHRREYHGSSENGEHPVTHHG